MAGDWADRIAAEVKTLDELPALLRKRCIPIERIMHALNRIRQQEAQALKKNVAKFARHVLESLVDTYP